MTKAQPTQTKTQDVGGDRRTTDRSALTHWTCVI